MVRRVDLLDLRIAGDVALDIALVEYVGARLERQLRACGVTSGG